MAKWMFARPSASTAHWIVQPLNLPLDPMTLSSARAISAFAVLLLFLAVTQRSALRVSARDVPFLAVFGVVGLAGVHFTYFKAISLTNVATAILLQYLAPVLVLVVGVAFLGHPFRLSLPVGVALSVSGCALVTGAVGTSAAPVPLDGIAWGLAAAVLFATYSLLGGVAAKRYRPYTTLVYGLGFAAVFWLLALGVRPLVAVFSNPAATAAVLVMAVVSTVIPFAAFLAAMRDIAPTNATITATIEPVIAGVAAYFLFGETMTALQLLGGVIVLVAILVVQLTDASAEPSLPVRE